MSELEIKEKNLLLKGLILAALAIMEFTYFLTYGEYVYLYSSTSTESNTGIIVMFASALLILLIVATTFILILVSANKKEEKPTMNKVINIFLYVLIGLFIAQIIITVLVFADIG